MQVDHTQKVNEIVSGLAKMLRTDVLVNSVACDEYGNTDRDGYVEDFYGEENTSFEHACGLLIGFNVATATDSDESSEEYEESSDGIFIILNFEGIEQTCDISSTTKNPWKFRIMQLESSNRTQF